MSERFNLDSGASVTRKFKVRVNDAGELKPVEPGRWIACLAGLRGRTVEVTISRPKRSNAFNAFWWAVVVPLAAELLTAEARLDPPIPAVPVHYKLVEAFGPSVSTPLGLVPVRSSEMSTDEFTDLVSKVREWMLHKYGVVCPTPDDRWAA
jgi:hypothetical protein